jgi:hypothetical protein
VTVTRRPAITLIPATLAGVALDLARQHRPDLILLSGYYFISRGRYGFVQRLVQAGVQSGPSRRGSRKKRLAQFGRTFADGPCPLLPSWVRSIMLSVPIKAT